MERTNPARTVAPHTPARPRATGRRTKPARLEAEIFEAFPYGILVVDRDGTILAANPAAVAILGDAASTEGRPGSSSCELLGCRQAGPLENVCLTEMAAEQREALPEIRLDLPPAAPVRAAWVTASALDGERVLVELRPGDLRDRRRRTEPHWTAGAQLRIYTFGGTRVESSEGPIGGRWLEQRPGQLFKYLLAERHRVVRREEIAETIWPGADRRILGSVRHFVHALRARLEPQRAPRESSSFILNIQGGYAIDRRHVYIDADDFEDQVRAGLDHLAAGRVMLARERLERALALYTGDFLADEPYADWAMVQRDALRRLAADALRALTAIARRSGDLDAAGQHLERLGELEPFDIDVHREIMGLCLARGRRSEALRRFAALRVRIMRTFGEDVDFSLADLREVADEPDAATENTG